MKKDGRPDGGACPCETMVKIDRTEFLIWSKYIHEISGIHLAIDKSYLIESRLGGLLREFKCSTFGELYRVARADAGAAIEKKIIDLITTSETSFFRDGSPFAMFKYKILPELIDRRTAHGLRTGRHTLRIWSAGCSTGQEVYSIAIALKELLQDLSQYNIRIIGTDISGEAIARASRGSYNSVEIQRGLAPDVLGKHFVKDGDRWKIRDEVRALVTFKRKNLLQPNFDLGRFDIIFCRNVAIYFNVEDRRRLFQNIADRLERDGYLIIGSTESLTTLCSYFKPKRYLRSVFYQLVD